MNIYNYDELGVFTRESLAKPNPRVEGKYRLPKQATFIVPPVISSAYTVAVFSGTAWTTQKDYRDIPYYILPDREPKYIFELDVDIPQNAILELPPLTQEELDAIEEERLIEETEAWRLEKIRNKLDESTYKKIDIDTAEKYINGSFDLDSLDALLDPFDASDDLLTAKAAIRNIFIAFRKLHSKNHEVHIKELSHILMSDKA